MKSLIDFFKQAITLIKKDPVILAPCLIFFFLFKSMSLASPDTSTEPANIANILIKFLLLSWLLELLFKSVTMIMTQELKKKPHIDLSTSIKKTMSYIKQLIYATGLFILPTFFILQTTLKHINNESYSAVDILNVIIIFPLSIILHFLPAVIISSQKTTHQKIKETVVFIIKNIKKTIPFVLLTYIINFTSIILGLMFSFIPVVGQAIIQVAFQGIATSFIYISTYLFYDHYKVKKESPLSAPSIE